jgi:hypothetical protein
MGQCPGHPPGTPPSTLIGAGGRPDLLHPPVRFCRQPKPPGASHSMARIPRLAEGLVSSERLSWGKHEARCPRWRCSSKAGSRGAPDATTAKKTRATAGFGTKTISDRPAGVEPEHLRPSKNLDTSPKNSTVAAHANRSAGDTPAERLRDPLATSHAAMAQPPLEARQTGPGGLRCELASERDRDAHGRRVRRPRRACRPRRLRW